MHNDQSYKFSFVAAVVVHLIIFIFIFTKLMNATRPLAMQETNIINAVAISQNNIDNLPATPKVVQQKPLPPPPRVQPKQEVKPPEVKPQEVKPQPVQQDTAKLQKEKEAQIKLREALKKQLLEEQSRELSSLKKQLQAKRKAAALAEAQKRQEVMRSAMSQELAQEQKQLTEAHGSQVQGEINKYKAMIIQAISSQWIVPDGVDKGATCKVRVDVAPGGIVMNVVLTSSSGNPLLDRSALVAVQKASPLPVPQDASLFNEFRVINLTVRPEGIITN